MINKINSLDLALGNNRNKSNSPNKANSSKIAFGRVIADSTWSTGLAFYSREIYALRKNMTFYKIFTFLNPKPKLITFGLGTKLAGEEFIGHLDKSERIGELEKVYKRLKKKIKPSMV